MQRQLEGEVNLSVIQDRSTWGKVGAITAVATFVVAAAPAAAGVPSHSAISDVRVLAIGSSLGVSTDEASEIMAETAPIYDFMLANAPNPSFGAIWVTYNPYEVHVRSTDAAFTDAALASIREQSPSQCSAAEPIPVETAPTQSSSSQPPATDETVPTEPPATEPPATEPPATEPPATEPPATEPPTTTTAAPTTPTPTTAPVGSAPSGWHSDTRGRQRSAPPPSAGAPCDADSVPAGTDVEDSALTANTTSLLLATATLQEVLNDQVNLHTGGATHAEVRGVYEASVEGRISVGVSGDFRSGTVTLFSGAGADAVSGIIRPEFVRSTPEPPPTGEDEARGGDFMSDCTAGFAFTYSGGGKGIATAGHCPDSQTTGSDSLTLLEGYETCSPTDYQLMVEPATAGNNINGSDLGDINLHGIAGGFYPNQPSFVWGSRSLPHQGEIINYSSASPDSGACAGHVVTTVAYTNDTTGGDSGAPVTVIYGADNLLLVLHKGTYDGVAMGTGWTFVPPGFHICTTTNPC